MLIFTFWVIVSLFYFPIVYIEKDYIGIYDLLVLIIGFYTLVFKKNKIQKIYQTYFFFLLYLIIVTLINYINNLSYFSLLVTITIIKFTLSIFITSRILKKVPFVKAMKVIVYLFSILFIINIFNYLNNEWWNMSLVFHKYGSGAVLGFISSLFIIVLIIFKNLFSSLLFYTSLSLSLVNLIMSQGRTQLLGLISVLAIYLLFKSKTTTKIKYFILISFSIFISIQFNLINFDNYYGGNIFKYFNYHEILANESFQIRLLIWENELNTSFNNLWFLIFGQGIGHNKYIDGFYINLFSSLGIIGFFWFLIIVIKFYKKYKNLRLLIIFIAISSITGELIIQSYRTHASLAILLVVIVHYENYITNKRKIREK